MEGYRKCGLNFNAEVLPQTDINGETYFTWGALVLATPIESVEEKTKSWPVPGFYNLKYAPGKLTIFEYAGKPITANEHELSFLTELYNPDKQVVEPVVLVPMAGTILRQVTFKTFAN
ncbi:MAG: hypothetical protein IPP25_09130 [Saprospiraceae bacterium]|nr:hypothetical protein [Candidatus Opimibacter skivensis]